MVSSFAGGKVMARGAALVGAIALGYRLGRRARRRSRKTTDQVGGFVERAGAFAGRTQMSTNVASPTGNLAAVEHSSRYAAVLLDPRGDSSFVVAELERLTRLLDQGALSQGEFAMAKRELLDGSSSAAHSNAMSEGFAEGFADGLPESQLDEPDLASTSA